MKFPIAIHGWIDAKDERDAVLKFWKNTGWIDDVTFTITDVHVAE